MDTDTILDLVGRYRDNREFITNEEAAKMALVVPFTRALGYDPSSPREVRPEYTVELSQADEELSGSRMDFAIFDPSGEKPRMVIKTEPLGTDLRENCRLLAGYVAHIPDLHFGILTDGCQYLFYGDLENPGQMDSEPFFSFSLDDQKADWGKVAEFLRKFSRDAFSAETLVTDAEDRRHRESMIDRLVKALKTPESDEKFMKWITGGVYKKKSKSDMVSRLEQAVNEAVELALPRVMSGDSREEPEEPRLQVEDSGDSTESEAREEEEVSQEEHEDNPSQTATSEEKMELFSLVLDSCSKAGISERHVLYTDTDYGFDVSYRKEDEWFLRFSNEHGEQSFLTHVPKEDVLLLAPDSQVEDLEGSEGSRIPFEDLSQLAALKPVILRSLNLLTDGMTQISDKA